MTPETAAFVERRQAWLRCAERAIAKHAPLLSREAVRDLAPIVLRSWRDCCEAMEFVEASDFLLTI